VDAITRASIRAVIAAHRAWRMQFPQNAWRDGVAESAMRTRPFG